MESFFIGLVKVRLKGKRADLSALFLCPIVFILQ
jgi:hypothetical protein